MRTALLLLALLICASHPARAANCFCIDWDNLVFVVSAGTGGFLFFGPREKEDNLVEEDGVFGSEQGLFLDLDFNAFKKKGTWTSHVKEEIWLDIFPYVSLSRGKALEYVEAGIKVGVVVAKPGPAGLRRFLAGGVKFGRVKIEPTTAIASDSGRELQISEQTQSSFEPYITGYFELGSGFGYHISSTLKQFFVDSTRTADGQRVSAEIEIITFAAGLNYMWYGRAGNYGARPKNQDGPCILATDFSAAASYLSAKLDRSVNSKRCRVVPARAKLLSLDWPSSNLPVLGENLMGLAYDVAQFLGKATFLGLLISKPTETKNLQ